MAEPVRTCVGCRQRAPRGALLRVVARSGVLVPDPAGREAGRGAHLHPDGLCLALAGRRNAFPRALRVPGPLDDSAIRAYVEASSEREVLGPAPR